MSAPLLRVAEIALYERDVRLRMPFRFGVVTLTESPQAFARVRIELADGRGGWGMAAELLAPKWFDKDLKLSNEDNYAQLRLALRIARDAYLGDAARRSAFGHFAAHYGSQIGTGAQRGLNPLVANYGPALIDRALLDALCRVCGTSFYDAVRVNLPGIAPALVLPEFAGYDMDAFLGALEPAAFIAARHTVGLVDALTAADARGAVGDGLPETLEQVVAAYGQRYFKLKVGGKVAEDIERLAAIAAVLDRIPDAYFASLDGNEQYENIEGAAELWSRMCGDPRLRRLAASILFIEQPINRKCALEQDVSRLSREKPVIIDESDADLDAFRRARALGYTGVSSKTCKGLYKSMINAARCARWNAERPGTRYFMSGEDLTLQAGVAVQQDLALVNLLGITHVERNGHHYVNGMAGLSEAEQSAFLAAHPDLYERSHGAVRLRIRGGRMDVASLACKGYAAAAAPDWGGMREMVLPD
jgi:L-alanine-DL-glutamate epimerase-like enolase superfamily enzyme